MATYKKHREYVQFTKALREHGDITLWVAFDLCKNNTELINGRYADLNGGFIRRRDIALHANRIKFKPETLIKKLNLMVKKGWAEKTRTGYRLKSWKHVASMYGFNEFKVRSIIGHTKRQFNQNAAYTEIKSYISQGVHVKFQEIDRKDKISKSLLKIVTKLSLIRSFEERELKRIAEEKEKGINTEEQVIDFNPTPSVRQLAKALGFKSPSTISKINQNLEARNLIEMKKNNEFACMTENYPEYIKGHADLVGHHYRTKNDLGLVVMRRKKQTIFLK